MGALPDLQFGQHLDSGLSEVERLMIELSSGDRVSDPLVGMVKYHLNGGGRRLRARVALFVNEVLGGDTVTAHPWAAACELLHNATLVHDDVQDGDHFRRGHPTIWARYGLAQAINVGDLLLMLPFRALEKIDAPSEVRWHLSLALAKAAETVVRGQANEFELHAHLGQPDLLSRYLATVSGKTAALFSLPVFGSALLAGRDLKRAEKVSSVCARAGVVFQICDDLLDILGRKGRGETAGDLREGKVSSLVVQHLLVCPEDVETLKEHLLKPRETVTEAQVRYWLERFAKSGAVVRCRAWAQEISDECLEELQQLREEKLIGVMEPLLKTILNQVEESTYG